MNKNVEHIHHMRKHPAYSYPVHTKQRIYTLLIAPLILIILAFVVVHPLTTSDTGHVSILQLIGGLIFSFLRLIIAYAFAILLSLPLALLINRSALTERLLLPAFDILQSVPVLAFFPVIIIFFVQYHFLEGAAVFIIFINMLWNLVFSLVGGLRLIPGDIKAAAKIFGLNRYSYVREVLVPAVFPYFVTGSLLAWAQGWNLLIVAEVLHTYLPGGSSASDLYGIGSLMVHASAAGHGSVFLASILTMILAIAAMNLLIWQRLLHYSERYRFE